MRKRTKKQALVPVAIGAALAIAVCVAVAYLPEPERDGVRTGASAPVTPKGTVPGLDVSYWQGPKVDWPKVAKDGAKFAIIRATRGNPYVDPYFPRNAEGARRVGLLQGAYHFAWPHKSSGRTQADYFINNGGQWLPDGRSLPGALDLESDKVATKELPVKPGLRRDCYNLTPTQMVAWIKQFSDRYLAVTGRRPLIYTNQSWWNNCTKGSAAFAKDHALWVANYQNPPKQPLMPKGWPGYTFWQFWNANDNPLFPGDQDAYTGTLAELYTYASRRDRPVTDAKIAATAARRKGISTYTIKISNTGPDGTGTLTLKTALPKGMTFKSENSSSCKKSGNGIACTWPKGLTPGTSLTFKMSAKGTKKTGFRLKTTALDWMPENNVASA